MPANGFNLAIPWVHSLNDCVLCTLQLSRHALANPACGVEICALKAKHCTEDMLAFDGAAVVAAAQDAHVHKLLLGQLQLLQHLYPGTPLSLCCDFAHYTILVLDAC